MNFAELDVPSLLATLRAKGQADVNHDYDPVWGKTLGRLQARLRAGETTLSRVLEGAGGLNEEEVSRYIAGKLQAGPALLLHHYQRDLRNYQLLKAAKDNDAVAELGSGPGLHLFRLWLAGGPRTPYHAFEISETGRLCTELLAELEPNLDIAAHAFNYYEPDYGPLASSRRLLVYTSGSIEQIAELPEAAITGLLDREAVTCLHWEPVGWQIEPNPVHEKRCRALGYNQNLWPLLRGLEQQGRLVIEDLRLNEIGKPHHMAAFIRWRSR